MGVYLYTLRKSKFRNTQLGPVYCYEYKDRLAKSGYWDCGGDKWVDAPEVQQQYIERYEERFDFINNCLVCVAGEEGTTVYRQEESIPIWWDGDGIEGTAVGVLRKRKNRWYISIPQEEFDEAMSFMISYAHRNQFVLALDLSTAYEQCREHFSKSNMKK